MSSKDLITRVNIHEDICRDLNALYERKNADYGNSFGESFDRFGLAMPAIRIGDKFNRLASFAKKGENVNMLDLNALLHLITECRKAAIEDKNDLLTEARSYLVELMTQADMKVTDESLEDTLMDLANYAIMTLIELRIKKEGK